MNKTWTDVPHGTIIGAQQRFWVALGNNAEAVANRINTDPGFVDRLAKFAEEHCVILPNQSKDEVIVAAYLAVTGGRRF